MGSNPMWLINDLRICKFVSELSIKIRRCKMTNDEKTLILRNRIASLENNPKNIKCPGVLKKLRRQLRNQTK